LSFFFRTRIIFSLLFQMQSEPNKGLLKLLERKKLTGLIEELTNDDEALADWKNRSKEDWKEIAGTAAGIDIYNYLHPNPKGILMLNSRNYFKINSWN
jgi:hypothetical protein